MVNICFNAVIPFDYTVALYRMLYEMEGDNFENNLDIEIDGYSYQCHLISYDKYCTDIKMCKYDCTEQSLYGDKYYFKVIVELPKSFIEYNENNEVVGLSKQLYDLYELISEKYNFISIDEEDIMDIVDQYIIYRKSKDVKNDDNEEKMFFHTLNNKSIGIKKKDKKEKENTDSECTNNLGEKPIIDAVYDFYLERLKKLNGDESTMLSRDRYKKMVNWNSSTEKYYQDMIKRKSKLYYKPSNLKDGFTEEEVKKIKGDNEGEE